MAIADMSGQTFGPWVVKTFVDINTDHRTRWLCRCTNCGTEKIVVRDWLLRCRAATNCSSCNQGQLPKEAVLEILASSDSAAKLAAKFGINRLKVRHIRRGRVRRDVYREFHGGGIDFSPMAITPSFADCGEDRFQPHPWQPPLRPSAIARRLRELPHTVEGDAEFLELAKFSPSINRRFLEREAIARPAIYEDIMLHLSRRFSDMLIA